MPGGDQAAALRALRARRLDTTGAVRAVESITTGLQWRAVRPPVCITGTPGKQDLEACWELGALLAATVAG